jgi:hypothetical protein
VGAARAEQEHPRRAVRVARAARPRLLLAAQQAWTFYLFAIGLGFTWLATVPPDRAIVGKLFGVRYLATLFGDASVAPGRRILRRVARPAIAITHQGSYRWMWIADIVLAASAALVNFAIREPRSGVCAGAGMKNVVQTLAVTTLAIVCAVVLSVASPGDARGKPRASDAAAVRPAQAAAEARDAQCHIARQKRARPHRTMNAIQPIVKSSVRARNWPKPVAWTTAVGGRA